MSAYFNLPFSVHLTKRQPIDTRFTASNLTELSLEPNAFAGLGPVWVDSEQWYYYFTDETTYVRWPIGSGSSSTTGSTDPYLYTILNVTYKGQDSMSINTNYSSQFLLIENLTFKKDLGFNESVNGGQKYVTWDNANGLLEPDDEIILVYKEL